MKTHYMQSLDWLILATYFAILLAIGIWASMKRKKESSLFLADRSLRWYHIGFSMWGTNVGPSMLRMVCLRLHSHVGICVRSALFGIKDPDIARVHGIAVRSIHAKYPGMVHHCDNHHLMAGADTVCRRHSDTSGV